jgi:hypothetical protein
LTLEQELIKNRCGFLCFGHPTLKEIEFKFSCLSIEVEIEAVEVVWHKDYSTTEISKHNGKFPSKWSGFRRIGFD